MPPRRAPFDPQMEELMRDMQRLQERMMEMGERRRESPDPTATTDPGEDEENPFHPNYPEGGEPRPNRFGVGYDRRPHIPQPAPPPRHDMDHDRRPYVLQGTPPPRHDYGVRIDLPTFEGGSDPDYFVDWLQEVERIFEYKEVPEDKRVSLAAIKLKKGASLWWENLKRTRLREGEPRIATWDLMKREIQRKYMPNHYKQDMFMRLHNIQQRDLTVEAYNLEFDLLMMKSDVIESEEHSIARYLGGLRHAIGNIVQLQPYWTLLDVQKLAIKVEKQQKNQRSFPPPRAGQSVNPSGGFRSNPPQAPSPTSSRPNPFHSGPRPAETPKFDRSGAPTPPLRDARKCFKCHGFGHIASGCPTRSLIIFGDEGRTFEQDKEPEAPEEDTD